LKRTHFDAIAPVCAVCRQSDIDSPLVIGRVLREEASDILEGILQCSRIGCQREYPILDGIPLLVPALRAYVSQNIFPILRRADFSDVIESILGDCCGPGSALDQTRQHLSSYTWGHYSDQDPLESKGQKLSLLELLELGLTLAGPLGPGPILDAGCAVGRSSFELAERQERLVLGIDVNFSMLQVASRALRIGQIRYPRRRVGLVYDERVFPVHFQRPDLVDFWVCDALAPPFPKSAFSLVTSLNLLDCLSSPHEHLVAIRRALVSGGRAILCTPYDWSPAATPIEGWIGGHSQRGPQNGDSAAALRALLTPNAHPASIDQLELVADAGTLPWRVRLHDRSMIEYATHLVVAEKR